MNILEGEITEIVTADELSLVRVNIETSLLTTVIIDSPANNPSLRTGHRVKLLFKETEVILSKTFTLDISIRNRIECRIKKVRTGKILCEITLTVSGIAPAVEIRSVITQTACEELDLRENDRILALIKTNEVSLLTND
jgi:molybdate transport system regulatory protein